MEIILKQRIVGSIVIIAILSLILPIIVISKDEVFNKKLISNIPSKPVFKISLPDSAYQQDIGAESVASPETSSSDTPQDTSDSSQRKVDQAAARDTSVDSTATTISAVTTKQPEKDVNQVALIIPLTDKAANKATTAHQSNDPDQSSTKLVASAPKGDELVLPDLVSISKVFKKFINEGSDSGNDNNFLASKNIAPPATTPSTDNKRATVKLSLAKPSVSKPSTVKASPVSATKVDPNTKAKLKATIKTSIKTNTTKTVKLHSGWVVQVGSFSKKSNASKLQSKLAKRGHNSYVELAKSKNGVIYRVRVGPQKNQAGAKIIQRKILKQEKLESIVLRYPR